jgi:hypothetical protein
MDRVFRKGSAVEALDTKTGTWREATILVVSPRTVSVRFTGFARGKCDATEWIGEDCPRSNWPVRNPTPTAVEAVGTKKRAQRAVRHCSYDPFTRALADTVSIVWGLSYCCPSLTYCVLQVHSRLAPEEEQQEHEVVFNDPFQRTVTVCDDVTQYLHEEEMRLDLARLDPDFLTLVVLPYDQLQDQEAPAVKTEPEEGEETKPRKRVRIPTAPVSTPGASTSATSAVAAVAAVPDAPLPPSTFMAVANPEASPTTSVSLAPCANGVLAVGCTVELCGLAFKCVALLQKEDYRVVAHIVGTQTPDCVAAMPASILELEVN